MFNRLRQNRLFSASAVYLLSNVMAAAIPFALLPVLTRYLGPAAYGKVAIYQTLLTGLGALIGLGAQGAAGVKYYDRDGNHNEMKDFIGSCLLILAASSVLTFLVMLAVAEPLIGLLALPKAWLLLSVVVATATFVVGLRMGQWQVRGDVRRYGVFQVSQSLLNMLFSLWIVVVMAQGADGRMGVLSLVPVLFAAIALLSLWRDGLVAMTVRRQHVREILSFGVPLIPHTIGFFLLSAVDRFVINDRLGVDQVGIYVVAVQLVAVLSIFFDAINNAYVPWLFERLKRDQLDEKKQIVRWTYLYGAALLAVVGSAFLIGPPLLVLIAGEKYAAAGRLIGLLVLGQAFHGMYLMVTNYIFYSKRTGLLSVSTIAAGALNVILLLKFLPLFGLYGAALSYAIAMGAKFLMTWYIAQLRHAMPWFSFRPTI